MARLPVGKAAKSHLPSGPTVDMAAQQRSKHGYDYYGSPNEHIAALADVVVAEASVAHVTQEEFVFERKGLFVGVTDATYYLQDCVEAGLEELGFIVRCAVDSRPVGQHGELGGSLINTYIHTCLRQ